MFLPSKQPFTGNKELQLSTYNLHLSAKSKKNLFFDFL